jgi:hypothetical protein
MGISGIGLVCEEVSTLREFEKKLLTRLKLAVACPPLLPDPSRGIVASQESSFFSAMFSY